jgi:hypothetical protein
MWPASLTALGLGDLLPQRDVGISHATPSILVTHRARDPPICAVSGLVPTRLRAIRDLAVLRGLAGLPTVYL